MLALLSGILLALSFPSAGHPVIAWVALVPLILAVARSPSPTTAFRSGVVTGVVHFAATIYWIPRVMVEFGGLPTVIAWGVHFLLVGYLALFPALFALVLWMAVRRYGTTAVLFAPAVWVSSELGRMYLFTGFPWELLGYSQVPFLWIAQAASVVGVLGVSALVAWVNTVLAFTVLNYEAGRGWPRRLVGATTGVVVGVLVFGGLRVQTESLTSVGVPLRVGVVQGNIAQDDKWNPVLGDTILDKYLALTEEAAAEGAQLIVWPEAATPFAFDVDARADGIRQLARDQQVHVLLGTTDVVWDDDPRYYNAAVLVDPRGETVGTYHKQHLVPFGEYVPLRDALFFVSPLVENVGGFSAGAEATTLRMGEHAIATVVCYEIIYPGLVREFVTGGGRLLITVTNDAWYGRTAAPHQHFQQATMRAIEQGRYLVRAANTGISGVIDPYGRVEVRTELFQDDVITDEVGLLDGLTLYARFGDLPAFACGVVTLALVVGARRRSRR